VDPGATASGRVDALFNEVISELERRFKDDGERAKLPGTGLLNLGLLLLKQREPEKPKDQDEDIDPLEVINSVDLPEDRKQQLIRQELDRLDTLRAGLTNALEVDNGEGHQPG
jgi:hypothetical protein